jgi:hypothetical protein
MNRFRLSMTFQSQVQMRKDGAPGQSSQKFMPFIRGEAMKFAAHLPNQCDRKI